MDPEQLKWVLRWKDQKDGEGIRLAQWPRELRPSTSQNVLHGKLA